MQQGIKKTGEHDIVPDYSGARIKTPLVVVPNDNVFLDHGGTRIKTPLVVVPNDNVVLDHGGTRIKTPLVVVPNDNIIANDSGPRIKTPLVVVPSDHVVPDCDSTRTKTPLAVVANDNDRMTLRHLGWSPSQPAAIAESQVAAKAEPSNRPESVGSGKTALWLLAVAALVATGTLIFSLPTTPNAVAGLSIRELASIEAIVFLSGVMSGLSGFGFSAIGAATLLLLPPILQVPLFQTLSTGNQLLSAGQLRDDMPKSWKDVWAGPGPCMLGGVVGVPIGIWLLSHLPAAQLMAVFGTMLFVYAAYSMFKPASFKLRGFDSPVCGAAVGLLGGVVGGFTAFPGAAVVVWTGLRGLPKAQHRAIVQPYIIMSQIYSLGLIALLHPSYLSGRFWLLLALSLPAVVPGTLSGLAIYRRLSDLNFKRVTFLLLGISGIALLAKTCGPVIMSLF
jgi:uncharacterized membrane protein YfcA